MLSRFSGRSRHGHTEQLHLRVAALGVLWCVLGIALGFALTLRLSSIRNDALGLSTERLPMVMALQSLEVRIAQAHALAHRVATSRGDADDHADALGRLTMAVESLDEAISGIDPGGLRPTDRTELLEVRTSATVISGQCRILAVGTTPPDAIAASLGTISDHASKAEAGLGRIRAASVTPSLAALSKGLEAHSTRIMSEVILAGAAAFAVGAILTIVVTRLVRRKEVEQADDRDRQEFQSRVSDAFSMVDEEVDAFHLLEEVLATVTPNAPTELLLADSSRAHLLQVAAACGATHGAPMCGVRSPSACPAVRRGSAVCFANSEEFDACPHLRGRLGGACSATCVPLSIMGQHVGVLHSVTPLEALPDATTTQRLTMVAARVGERVGVIRAFAQSEKQAARDPLTGLLNRRSAEAEIQRLQRSGTSFVIGYADIDHFKRLNDTHGHETGDKALRLFSRILRDSLRPGDIVARWGGEEFVIILPQVDIESSRPILERLREVIASTTGGGSVPVFTISIGVSSCEPNDDFSEQLAEADAALLAAKSGGRNRIATKAAIPDAPKLMVKAA